MYAQCPGCYSVYRMDSEILTHAHGQVRCSVCELVFDAVATLRDRLPETEPVPGANAQFEFYSAQAEAGEDEADNHTAPVAPEALDPEADAIADTAPEQRQSGPRWLWLLGCVLLLGVVVWQLLYRAPAALAQYPHARPIAETLCAISDCALPPRQDLSRISLASRDVRAHPSVADALMVSATLVNEAEFAQPFPVLELRLSNLDGVLIAMRRFEPVVYLPDTVARHSGMAPGSRVGINLEVLDPPGDAVSFEFSFAPSG